MASDPLVDPAITQAELVSSPPDPAVAAAAVAAVAVAAADGRYVALQDARQYASTATDDGAAAVAGTVTTAPDMTPLSAHDAATFAPTPPPQPALVQLSPLSPLSSLSQLSQLPQMTPSFQASSPHPPQPPQPPQAPQAPPPPPAAIVQHYNPAAHAHLILYLAALHGSRITANNLSGTFVAPLNHEKLLDWWKVQLTTAAVFLLIRSPPTASGTLYAPTAAGVQPPKVTGQDLVGAIMLRSHPAETSPHVASVELLLVNLQYRELGGERQLLETVEQQAVLEGRTLLTAETESDSSAAHMFSDLGFTEAGRIPGMIMRPSSGERRPLSIFYKDLTRL